MGVLLAWNLFHYMAEACGSPFASHQSRQGSHAECGCGKSFPVDLYNSLPREYFALRNRHISVFCSTNALKDDPDKTDNFLVTERYITVLGRTFEQNSRLLLVKEKNNSVDIFCLLYQENRHATNG